MERRTWIAACAVAAMAAGLAGAAAVAHAGFGDALKKKLGDKAKKVEQKADDATGGSSDDGGAKKTDPGADAAAASAPAGQGGVAAVSTKFDYVPGDSVLLADDFTQDDLGEFPARWTLKAGTWEVAEQAGTRWLRCTSSSGVVRMKAPPGLPEFWTLEFDWYGVDLGGAIALTLDARTESGGDVWETRFPYSGDKFEFNAGDIRSETPLEGTPVEGRHRVMYMARGSALKVYLDRQRVASVPDALGRGRPAALDFALAAPGHPMITNVRFAAGCRPTQDALDAGRLVTYGIRFDTGSDVVQPESAPVLRQVAAWMGRHADAKLRITGHTDNVGAAAANLDLSKRRAAAVAKALAADFGVDAGRFTTDGKGDTQPLAPNAKAEGRAMNRRVEFAKL